MSNAPAANNQAASDQLEAIAKKHLWIETLETRHSDRLDFHEVGVASLKAALQAAFEAGKKSRGGAVRQEKARHGGRAEG